MNGGITGGLGTGMMFVYAAAKSALFPQKDKPAAEQISEEMSRQLPGGIGAFFAMDPLAFREKAPKAVRVESMLGRALLATTYGVAATELVYAVFGRKKEPVAPVEKAAQATPQPDAPTVPQHPDKNWGLALAVERTQDNRHSRESGNPAL